MPALPKTTVAHYLLRRLADAGVRSVVGTPGDGDVHYHQRPRAAA